MYDKINTGICCPPCPTCSKDRQCYPLDSAIIGFSNTYPFGKQLIYPVEIALSIVWAIGAWSWVFPAFIELDNKIYYYYNLFYNY